MSIYACADLHGNGILWNKIKEFLKPEDHLYFLGDAIDRGPDGWAMFKEMIDHPQVTYILGNHEYMMEQYMRVVQKEGHDEAVFSEESMLWKNYNGGYPTYEAWYQEGHDPDWVIDVIEVLPLSVVIRNIEGVTMILTHAGFTPDAMPEDIHDLVWDRRHCLNVPRTDYSTWPPFIIVHGHTPCSSLERTLENETLPPETGAFQDYLYYEDTGTIQYWGMMKWDIDVGTIKTHKTVLLDLDTYEQHVITEE